MTRQVDRLGRANRVLDPRLFEIAYRLGTTVWVWPILALVLSFVIGPFALAPIIIFMVIYYQLSGVVAIVAYALLRLFEIDGRRRATFETM